MTALEEEEHILKAQMGEGYLGLTFRSFSPNFLFDTQDDRTVAFQMLLDERRDWRRAIQVDLFNQRQYKCTGGQCEGRTDPH